MTIYDVPVDDTVFFPVSGDMLRRMKHDEDQRLTKQNDTGDSAKNPSDAVNLNNLKGEQAMLHISISHNDLVVHPIWCDPEQCIAPDFAELGDRRLHHKNLGYIGVAEREGIDVTLVKFDDEDPEMIVGDASLNLQQLENLILLLDTARVRLIEATGTGYTLTNAGRDALERED
ncbi:hypothetical protein [Brevibacterium renqingii]|uniref:hypothetical protein n=1 Tax=Brevibacterium renqingii TaxID=2776916 RepID=UPI001ADF0AF6|nr:hypothetical protein [Brevibacterium renqingii]